MLRPRYLLLFTATLAFSGYLIGQDSRTRRAEEQAAAAEAVEHPECSFFGPQRERFLAGAPERPGARKTRALSTTTDQVVKALAINSPIHRPTGAVHEPGTIDAFIWADLDKRRIKPAPPTTDWEFIRRVTLDLTGRIPTPERVLSFVRTPPITSAPN